MLKKPVQAESVVYTEYTEVSPEERELAKQEIVELEKENVAVSVQKI